MIQLGYYNTTQQQQQDESLDFDPNYDPSDFLLKKDPSAQPEPAVVQQQQQAMQFQESFDYSSSIAEGAAGDELQQKQNFYGSFANQSFDVNNFGFQQPQPMSQEDYSQPTQLSTQPLPNDGGGLADLEISDSDDEEEQNEEMNTSSPNPVDTSKEDDDGLWF